MGVGGGKGRIGEDPAASLHTLSLLASSGPFGGKGVPCEHPSTREVEPQKCAFGDSCAWF